MWLLEARKMEFLDVLDEFGSVVWDKRNII